MSTRQWTDWYFAAKVQPTVVEQNTQIRRDARLRTLDTQYLAMAQLVGATGASGATGFASSGTITLDASNATVYTPHATPGSIVLVTTREFNSAPHGVQATVSQQGQIDFHSEGTGNDDSVIQWMLINPYTCGGAYAPRSNPVPVTRW